VIVRLRGVVLEKGEEAAVIEAAGVGYEVHMTPSALARLPNEGSEVSLHVVESSPLYGGSVALYGFLDADEKRLFAHIKDHVPQTGAKKALEILERASRSLPDFRRAILEKDAKGLAERLGFTKKTAEKLVDALKDGLPTVGRGGDAAPHVESAADAPITQTLQALAALGYRSSEARAAVEAARRDLDGRSAGVEELIRLALKRL
jgi:Holliday junction DNA helicase RuvA